MPFLALALSWALGLRNACSAAQLDPTSVTLQHKEKSQRGKGHCRTPETHKSDGLRGRKRSLPTYSPLLARRRS